jgi:hypothetical protein
MSEIDECRVCGQYVLMICQKQTGYCSAACEESGR